MCTSKKTSVFDHLLTLLSLTGRSTWAGASRPKSHFSRRRNAPTLTPTMHFSCGLHGKNWTFLSINREVASRSHTHTHTQICLIDFDLFLYRPVDALLMMARSSVVPAGGASPESALHMLTQCRGDFVVKKTRWRCCCCCFFSPNENKLRFSFCLSADS